MTGQAPAGHATAVVKTEASTGRCRFCGAPLRTSVIDLGMSPLCEAYLDADQLNQMEPFYPLNVFVCDACLLVQVEAYVSPAAIFSDYAYFSSYSDSWLDHARRYVDGAVERYGLGPDQLVVELGSNDGYLLQYLVERCIPVLGVEPAANVAAAALERGVPTRVAFFGTATASSLVAEGMAADLVIGNNVLAQVPDLNDFIAGVAILLKPEGVATFEFPHLLRLIEGNQFDTIYHEHFSYFSVLAASRIFAAHGLATVDVEELPTHGGSLRLSVRHAGDGSGAAGRSEAVDRVLEAERAAGLADVTTYGRFEEQARETKRALLEFLIDAKRAGRSIAGYGAAGKGNTLLNYCGIGRDFLDYVVDRNPHKQGRFLPGTHIPIHHPDRLAETRPDVVLVLPWNLRDEIAAQLDYVRGWGGQLVVPIPRVEVVP
jgi:SAM-dependent methyltransferase